MRAFEISAGSTGIDGIRSTERPTPTVTPTGILVRMRAASLNFRDLMVAAGRYAGGTVVQDTIALSDGTGEVIEVGAAVTRFRVGDRVAGTFFQDWVSGLPSTPRASLGAPPADGVLAEYVVFDERDAVHIPAHLSFEEAATLPCAGVTAWHALVSVGQLRAGQTVLALGTGGVSVFALQIARMCGAEVIITSSSDEKLARARALGAHHTINYRTTPDWEREVMTLTQGRGVDHVVEVGGVGTLAKSMAAVAPGGKIALIGVLTGRVGDASPYMLMPRWSSITGIFVGSRDMFEDFNRAVAINQMQPVIDRVFTFDEAIDAYRYMERGEHFGKVVIRF
jgi:NADPH:quinone reductase-like Zn-dependent oxidoreductase